MLEDDKKRRAEEIIDGYYQQNLPPGTEESVQGWIASEDNPYVGVSIAKQFCDELKVAVAPDENTRRSLEEVHKILGFPQKHTISLHRRLMRVAAVLIPAITLGGSLFYMLNDKSKVSVPQVAQIQLEVSAEGSKEISLPDGSTVTLYENSRFTYPENYPADRTVSLDGKARFNVAKMEGKPFTVASGSFSVTVLGTEFSMTATSDNPIADIALFSGSVSVTGQEFEDVILSPGQQLTYDTTDNTFTVSELNEGRLLRLMDKGVEIIGRPLGEVFEILSGYFEVELDVVANIDLSAPIRFKLDKDVSLHDAFNVAGFASGIFDFSITGETVKIYPR